MLIPGRIVETGVHVREKPVYGHFYPAAEAFLPVKFACLRDRQNHFWTVEGADVATDRLGLKNHGDVGPFQAEFLFPFRTIRVFHSGLYRGRYAWPHCLPGPGPRVGQRSTRRYCSWRSLRPGRVVLVVCISLLGGQLTAEHAEASGQANELESPVGGGARVRAWTAARSIRSVIWLGGPG